MRFSKLHRIVGGSALAGCVALLFVPEPTHDPADGGGPGAFVWDADARWEELEARFVLARARDCAEVGTEVDTTLATIDLALSSVPDRAPSDDPRLDRLETELFGVAPLVAACPAHAPELIDRAVRIRARVKNLSRGWDLGEWSTRTRLYRLLYGSRMAVEEVLLQRAKEDVPTLIEGTDEPSSTPATTLLGAHVHSGDILVSRGGAPTSAFIARGNDFPGNFSHVALLHVAEDGAASVIEAHIERGVVVSTLDEYVADPKLRVMVLRLASSLPVMREDPMLPHRAAELALTEARSGHVPYDFAMDYEDHTAKFCSEVASAPYAEVGVRLWERLTSMSTRGTRTWLSRFGVTHFETHGPSDLEYDPKVVVVAEWRDPDTLLSDHIDNAVLDAMLEGAEAGDELDYDFAKLPLARLAKAYSLLENLFGNEGPVPEGMSATTALRAEWLRARHGEIHALVQTRIAEFRRDHGYTPPYWELVRMAREAWTHLR